MFILIGCTSESIDVDKLNNDISNFSVSDAKAFFIENATDLQGVNFYFDKRQTKSKIVSNIIPQWDDAIITQQEDIATVEIPLVGNPTKFAYISRKGTIKSVDETFFKVETTLIIQKHVSSDIEPRMFIVTIIQNDILGIDGMYTSGNYSKNNNYSGFTIISSLEGEYLESYQNINCNTKPVYIMLKSKDADYENLEIQLINSSNASYAMGEDQIIIEKCALCSKALSSCFCEGIIVTPKCPYCGLNISLCKCCPICKSITCLCNPGGNPGSYACQYCGRIYCNGLCQNEGGGGGGGEGGDEGGDDCGTQCSVCGGYPSPIAITRNIPEELCEKCICPKDECSDQSITTKNSVNSQISEIASTKSIGGTSISWEDFIKTVNENNLIEHATSLNNYGEEGSTLSEIGTGNENNVMISHNIYTVACIHSHPSSRSPYPSPMDIHFTAKLCYIYSNSNNFKSTYTYNKNGDDYVLTVTDPTKAIQFYKEYSSNFDTITNHFKDKSTLGDYYEKISTELEKLPVSEQEIYRLSSLLKKFNTGIVIGKFSFETKKSEIYDVDIDTETNKITTKKCK